LGLPQAVTVATLLGSSAPLLPLPQTLVGKYHSSAGGGCSLDLRKDGDFTLTCVGRQPVESGALWLGERLRLPLHEIPQQPPIAFSGPAQREPSAWPPSVADPTTVLLTPPGTSRAVVLAPFTGARDST
jgi:hypothetical protein